jgi:hypothetical protein
VPPLPFSPSSSAAPAGSCRGPPCDPLELPSRELPQIWGGDVLMAARSATAELQRLPRLHDGLLHSFPLGPPGGRWSPFRRCAGLHRPGRIHSRGKAVKQEAEPDGATLSWLLLVCGSHEGLQRRLHTWSRCGFHRLAGLQPEPLLEPLLEPCQTGPYYLAQNKSKNIEKNQRRQPYKLIKHSNSSKNFEIHIFA